MKTKQNKVSRKVKKESKKVISLVLEYKNGEKPTKSAINSVYKKSLEYFYDWKKTGNFKDVFAEC